MRLYILYVYYIYIKGLVSFHFNTHAGLNYKCVHVQIVYKFLKEYINT